MIIERMFRTLHIAAEGKHVILAGLFICVVLGWMLPVFCFLFVSVFIFLLFFFRDPDRDIPHDPAVFVSPADGRIVDMDRIPVPEFDNEHFLRIGIFLSIFDVHVQRFPCSGEIIKKEYKKGKFHAAFQQKTVKENESNTIVMRTDHGQMIIKQIAGFVARRVICHVPVGKRVVKGERMGIIMFGSRVEFYIHPEIELAVAIGQKVVGGETILGALMQDKG